MTPAVIVDLDGTLCDVSSIEYLVTGTKKNFHAFHAASAGCPVNREVLAAVRAAHEEGKAVLVVTGREFIWRDLSLDWLDEHDVPYDRLEMRFSADHRPDHVVKAEILAGLEKDGFTITDAWDDREDIAELWRSHGITVHLVPRR